MTEDALAERRARVAKLTSAGLSAAAIAALEGFSPRSVQRHRHDAGVSRNTAPPMSADELRYAAELLDDGCSFAEVARTLGRCPRSIRYHFPGRGWDRTESSQFAVSVRLATERMRAVYA